MTPQVTIAAAGAVPPLVALVHHGSELAREEAGAALANLAVNAENQVAIATAGAVEALVELVRCQNAGGQEAAARALRNLAVNAQNQVCAA